MTNVCVAYRILRASRQLHIMAEAGSGTSACAACITDLPPHLLV